MEYHLSFPLSKEKVNQLQVEDVLYVSGNIFTARDEAHKKLIREEKLPFDPSQMALFHCGPLMHKKNEKWEVISAGPTTSSRMEDFEAKCIEKCDVRMIIGKGGMGDKTMAALQKYGAVYAAFTGGASAVAAEKISGISHVYWLDELGMPEAVWVFDVEEFGPLIVAMDSHGETLYK